MWIYKWIYLIFHLATYFDRNILQILTRFVLKYNFFKNSYKLLTGKYMLHIEKLLLYPLCRQHV